MNKKFKAALAGLAFVAGCEIGIAIQLMKMIHKFTIRESASNTDADYPEEAEIDVTMNEAESEVSDEAYKEVANSVVSPAMEFVSEGMVMGLGAKMFIIAGPVIVYGTACSVLYGLILCTAGLFT